MREVVRRWGLTAGPHCSLRCRVLLWSVLRKEPSLTVNLGLDGGRAAGNILPSALKVSGRQLERSWHLPSADSLADVSVNSLRVDLSALPKVVFLSSNNPKSRTIIIFSCMLRN